MSTHPRLCSNEDGPLFTTFRLTQNSSSASNGDSVRHRKRLRTILSCNECHRSKVRCDRARPCARCLLTGRETQCAYSTDDDAATPQMRPPQNRGTSAQMYYHRREHTVGPGRTYWADVICEDAAQYIFGRVPDFQDTFQMLTQLKNLYPTRTSHNFPFSYGSPISRTTIIEKLPSSAIVNALVENYFNTFEQACPLLDYHQFKEELSGFWITSHAGCDTWLAQLLMMLSLSCSAADQQILNEYGHDMIDRLSKDCLCWAAATLGCASPAYMDFPDLYSIRTLSMMIIAKWLDVESPSSGGLWALEGFLVRLAMSMSLHRDPSTMPEMPVSEANNRRKIWNTIIFLDLSAAIDSGLPATLKPSDWDTAPPYRIEGEGNDNADCFQNILASAYPVVALVLSWINSPSPKMTYDKVLECNNRIRAILHEADSAFSVSLSTISSNSAKHKQVVLLQQTMLNILLRRTLLALHRPYDDADLQEAECSTSHWSVLECSLALLHSQHELYERIDNIPSLAWFADLFNYDFAVAMLHVISGLRSQSFSDVTPNNEGEIDNLQDAAANRMARTTTRTALQGSFEIVQMSAGRTFHHFKILIGVALSIAAFEASESGIPLLEAMESAAQSIIKVVKQSRGK